MDFGDHFELVPTVDVAPHGSEGNRRILEEGWREDEAYSNEDFEGMQEPYWDDEEEWKNYSEAVLRID